MTAQQQPQAAGQQSQAAGQRPRAAGPGSVHPLASGKTGPAIVRHDQADIGGQTDGAGGSANGMTPRERLDAYAQRFLDRLDNLMQKEGLSEEQVAALQDARTEFQRNIERIDDAFLEGGRSRDGVNPALNDIVAALRESVQEALGRARG